MMPERRPLFLERRTYRLRRLMDAARMLPVLGAVLFFVPILWGAGRSGETSVGTAEDGVFLFGVWFALILGAALISRALARADGRAEGKPPGSRGEEAP